MRLNSITPFGMHQTLQPGSPVGDVGVRFTAGTGGYLSLGERDGYHFLQPSCFLAGQNLELDADRSEEPLGFRV
jgi:hypothetical protein